MSGVLLTAGRDRSWNSVTVAENLRRAGHAPALILIAYPASFKRIHTLIRSRGLGAIARYLLHQEAHGSEASPLRERALAAGLVNASLRTWARRHGVPCISLPDLNCARALRLVRSLQPSITAYTGGGILRKSFLDAAGRRVINAHAGPLPAIRGMNACEWSLLLGKPLAATLHFIDEGIDTGPIVERVPVVPHAGDTLPVVRERCIVAGGLAMVNWVSRAAQGEAIPMKRVSNVAPERQCFVLAPALAELLNARLPALLAQQRQLPSTEL